MAGSFNKMKDSASDWYDRKTEDRRSLPNGFLHDLTFDMLGHGFLEGCSNPESWDLDECETAQPLSWVRFERLPTHPTEEDRFDLLERWQSVLSSAHALQLKIGFVLLRRDHVTSLYVGAYDPAVNGGIVPAAQLMQSIQTHMTGTETRPADGKELSHSLAALRCSGLVTGIPSLRGEGGGKWLQTLGKLASGVSVTDKDEDYALVIRADPVEDHEITDLIGRLLDLKSDIHQYSSYSKNYSLSEQEGVGKSGGGSIGVLAGLGLAALCVGVGLGVAAPVTAGMSLLGVSSVANMLGAGGAGFFSLSKQQSVSRGDSTTLQYVDENARYCEEILQSHIKRMEKGRNLGFWNTGIYVLGRDSFVVDTVLGTLRSVYSGNETYVEPIRTFSFGSSAAPRSYISRMRFIPLPVPDDLADKAREALHYSYGWHVLGRLYESFSTPLTTEELSIASNLPRRDVPGLKTVRTAVKFAANPPAPAESGRNIHLGDLVDMGAATGMEYELNVDELTRHAILTGLNGSGKTTTARRILEGVNGMDIPFLVVDPVKTDYIEWAIKFNSEHQGEPGFKKINYYMPGYEFFTWFDKRAGELTKTPLGQLKLNSYRPGTMAGAPVDIMGHVDSLAAILSSSMSMGEVLPMLLQEAMYSQAFEQFGSDANSHEVDADKISGYPRFSGLMDNVREMMADREYNSENKGNLTACMETRINSLLRGWKSDFFDAAESTPPETLFDQNTVISLYGITDNKDKALAMSLLLQLLREYRTSRYFYDRAYREKQSEGRDRLLHFTVIEEAHRILMRPDPSMEGMGNPQAVVAGMFNEMLSEVRAYGEGLMIVDQYPSRLTPDAIKNTNIKIIHKLQAQDDREMVGSCMGLNDEQTEMLAALEKGNVIISSEQDDKAMWVKVRR